jgi:hypothetical protein
MTNTEQTPTIFLFCSGSITWCPVTSKPPFASEDHNGCYQDEIEGPKDDPYAERDPAPEARAFRRLPGLFPLPGDLPAVHLHRVNKRRRTKRHAADKRDNHGRRQLVKEIGLIRCRTSMWPQSSPARLAFPGIVVVCLSARSTYHSSYPFNLLWHAFDIETDVCYLAFLRSNSARVLSLSQ